VRPKNVNAVPRNPFMRKGEQLAVTAGRTIFFGRPLDPVRLNSGGWWWVGFGVPQIPLSLSARDRSVARDFIFHPPDSSL
jgi:hypothetical protein